MNEINVNVENYPDDPDLLIPFSITYREGGDYDISCYCDSLEIVGEYAEKFGMLCQKDYMGQNTWQWTEGPWPWEYEEV